MSFSREMWLNTSVLPVQIFNLELHDCFESVYKKTRKTHNHETRPHNLVPYCVNNSQVHRLSLARYGFTLCLSTRLICIHVTAIRHAVTQKCKHVRQRETIMIRMWSDNPPLFHIHVFILHDRAAGVFLLLFFCLC